MYVPGYTCFRTVISRHPWGLTQDSNKVYSSAVAVTWLVLSILYNFSCLSCLSVTSSLWQVYSERYNDVARP